MNKVGVPHLHNVPFLAVSLPWFHTEPEVVGHAQSVKIKKWKGVAPNLPSGLQIKKIKKTAWVETKGPIAKKNEHWCCHVLTYLIFCSRKLTSRRLIQFVPAFPHSLWVTIAEKKFPFTPFTSSLWKYLHNILFWYHIDLTKQDTPIWHLNHIF